MTGRSDLRERCLAEPSWALVQTTYCECAPPIARWDRDMTAEVSISLYVRQEIEIFIIFILATFTRAEQFL